MKQTFPGRVEINNLLNMYVWLLRIVKDSLLTLEVLLRILETIFILVLKGLVVIANFQKTRKSQDFDRNKRIKIFESNKIIEELNKMDQSNCS